MAEPKPTVTLKDGTVITLDDPSQISQYSGRDDLDSISFGGDDAAPAGEKAAAMPAPPTAALFNASLSIDTNPQQTQAVVGQPKSDPVVPQSPPAGDFSTTISLTVGAISGAVSPALASFLKNFIKGKLKGKNSNQQEEESEEPTDCKTHQIKSNAKMVRMAARIAALESKNSDGGLFSGKTNPLEDLEERIAKLEKQANKPKRKS